MSENKQNGENQDNRIRELFDEVELYRQAIEDAQNALEAAEQELDEALDEAYGKELE